MCVQAYGSSGYIWNVGRVCVCVGGGVGVFGVCMYLLVIECVRRGVGRPGMLPVRVGRCVRWVLGLLGRRAVVNAV